MRLTLGGLAAALVLPLCGPTESLHAQTAPSTTTAPYSQLRLRLSAARNVNREALHDFWDAGTGVGVGLETPFYIGSVGVGATLIPFRTREAARPNFRAVLLGLDWGVGVPAPRAMRIRAAARIGDFVMLVDNPDVWLDSESELFVGGELSAAIRVWRNLAIAAAGSYVHVYTRPSLDLALVTIGLEYATRTPGWLQAILE